MVTQKDIARKVGVDVSTVNKILNRRPGPVFSKDTILKVQKAAKALGFNFGRLKFQHRRQHDRTSVSVPIVVEVFRKDGTLLDRGEAVLEDLSKGGARLAYLKLPMGVLPVDGSIGIYTQTKSAALSKPRRGELIRFCASNGQAGVTIRFLDGATE